MERCLSSEPHEEEILVLKSIFNEDFLSISNEDGSSTFDLRIRFDSLPKKILLIDEQSNRSTELGHLPPIILRITYRQTYPERDPPVYSILCDYLTDDQLLALANQMDAMWNSGDVIVYTWIELLKDCFYNISDQLILHSTGSSITDQRFLSNYKQIGSKRIYEQLVEYNRVQNQLEFEQAMHVCPICQQEIIGRDCLQFDKCHHYACLPCLTSYAHEYLNNIQESKPISCYECDSSLFLSELRRMFSNNELLLKYQRRLLEQTVDMVWCPRCHQSIVCTPSESTSGNHRSFVECLHCQFTFCRRCQKSWHPQIECPKQALMQTLIEKRDEKQPNSIEIEKLLLEIANIQMIEHCSKPCPKCSVRIEKNGGCQHMNCRACNVHFCWTCGWYGSSYAPHSCQQQPDKAQASLPAYINEQIDRVLYDADGKPVRNDVGKRIQLCPKEDCRQAHVKIGSRNMLICETCETKFCFVCGEAIYGKFHFSEYGCKEETRI